MWETSLLKNIESHAPPHHRPPWPRSELSLCPLSTYVDASFDIYPILVKPSQTFSSPITMAKVTFGTDERASVVNKRPGRRTLFQAISVQSINFQDSSELLGLLDTDGTAGIGHLLEFDTASVAQTHVPTGVDDCVHRVFDSKQGLCQKSFEALQPDLFVGERLLSSDLDHNSTVKKRRTREGSSSLSVYTYPLLSCSKRQSTDLHSGLDRSYHCPGHWGCVGRMRVSWGWMQPAGPQHEWNLTIGAGWELNPRSQQAPLQAGTPGGLLPAEVNMVGSYSVTQFQHLQLSNKFAILDEQDLPPLVGQSGPPHCPPNNSEWKIHNFIASDDQWLQPPAPASLQPKARHDQAACSAGKRASSRKAEEVAPPLRVEPHSRPSPPFARHRKKPNQAALDNNRPTVLVMGTSMVQHDPQLSHSPMKTKEHPEWAGVVNTHLHAHIGAVVTEDDLPFLVDQEAQDVTALERGGHAAHRPKLLPVHQSLWVVRQVTGAEHCWITRRHAVG
ncbi:hypothetical protein INR49_031098 [Caranx melampygus]|nr:hypothetical protein INR49_031098 [Caranx melampygus]